MKIVICGGGFSSLYISNLLFNNQEIYILEEHERIGDGVCCSGLVSKRVIENLPINVPIIAKINSVDIISPSGRIYSLDIKNELYVIDRREAEIRLMERCLDKVCILLGVRVIDVVGNSVQYKCCGEKKIITGDLIIGADGPNSVVRRRVMGIKSLQSLVGIQSVVKNYDNYNTIKIYVSNKFSDGLFAWEIPREDCRLIGLASYTNPIEHFKRLKRYLNVECNDYCIKLIPINLSKKIEMGIVKLLGDSAGMCKGTSGGGIYPSIIASKILARNISTGQNNYQREFMAEYGRYLKLMYFINQIYRRIGDKQREIILRSLENESITQSINKDGDVDYPFHFMKSIIKN